MSILSALTFDSKKITNEGLRRLNILLAVLYFIEGVVILLISNYDRAGRAVSVGFLSKDSIASDMSGHAVAINASRHLFDINLVYVVAASLLVAVVVQFLMSIERRAAYEAELKKSINSIRWGGYVFSFGLASLALALGTGVSDITLLGLIFALGIITFTSTRQIESKAINASQLPASSYSFLPALLVILIYIVTTAAYASVPSAFIYIGFIVLCLWLAVIYRNLQLVKLGGITKDYRRLERSYLLSSFIGLSLIAWCLYAAALR